MDLEKWNNLPVNVKLQIGQRLFIPGSNTAGYSTPTPPGMVQVSTPAQDGKIVHTVQLYQALSTIAQAYGVDIQTILTLNGIQADWPLQIGQKLVIRPSQVTPSPTPRPLTALEKLTPETDGKYYHIVKSGETLTWIAKLYEVKLTDLMTWNGLDGTSVLRLNQKLLLQVTPPATPTHTPGPPTATPAAATATLLPPPTSTATLVPTRPAGSPAATAVPPASDESGPGIWLGLIALVAAGAFLVIFFSRRKL
jgi:LysM repeat protein